MNGFDDFYHFNDCVFDKGNNINIKWGKIVPHEVAIAYNSEIAAQ